MENQTVVNGKNTCFANTNELNSRKINTTLPKCNTFLVKNVIGLVKKKNPCEKLDGNEISAKVHILQPANKNML